MININLLPPEYRKSEATPVARFLAIVIGAVVVTTGLVAYGYVHYSQLRTVQEVRGATEEEFKNKKAQADVSKNLQAEINAYEARRKAIQSVARNRILQSRKLDEFLNCVYNNDDKSTYHVWLQNLAVKPPRAARRRQKITNGGSISFGGFCESGQFSRVTNLRDAIKDHVFYQDFQNITRPSFKEVRWDDGLEPEVAGKFSFDLVFKPFGWRASVKSKGRKGK